MQKAAIRKQSQRRESLSGKCCGRCGSSESLQRHHPSYTSSDFEIVCQTCHTAIHVSDGSWGKGSKRIKDCAICGKPFVPSHSKKHKTCSAACLSELGRVNAQKRWGATKTDATRLVTQSCHVLPNLSFTESSK